MSAVPESTELLKHQLALLRNPDLRQQTLAEDLARSPARLVPITEAPPLAPSKPYTAWHGPLWISRHGFGIHTRRFFFDITFGARAAGYR